MKKLGGVREGAGRKALPEGQQKNERVAIRCKTEEKENILGLLQNIREKLFMPISTSEIVIESLKLLSRKIDEREEENKGCEAISGKVIKSYYNHILRESLECLSYEDKKKIDRFLEQMSCLEYLLKGRPHYSILTIMNLQAIKKAIESGEKTCRIVVDVEGKMESLDYRYIEEIDDDSDYDYELSISKEKYERFKTALAKK